MPYPSQGFCTCCSFCLESNSSSLHLGNYYPSISLVQHWPPKKGLADFPCLGQVPPYCMHSLSQALHPVRMYHTYSTYWWEQMQTRGSNWIKTNQERPGLPRLVAHTFFTLVHYKRSNWKIWGYFTWQRGFRGEDLTAVFKCLKNYHVEGGSDIFCIAPEGKTKTNEVKDQGGIFHYTMRKLNM